MEACKIIISGRVQMVGFRYYTKKIADQLNITGWARNQQDGTVMVFAQGDPESLQKFKDLMRHGPGSAEVSDMQVLDVSPNPGFNDFEIVY